MFRIPSVQEISERLTGLHAGTEAPRAHATRLVYRGGGVSQAWDAHCEDGANEGTDFIVKCLNNAVDFADYEQGRPLWGNIKELVCGRLGALFNPAITPRSLVVDVPEAVAQGAVVPPDQGIRQPAQGPAFGSEQVNGAVETKARQDVADLAPPEQLARVIAFQTWLDAQDVSVLIAVDDDRAYSHDHSDYLGGRGWQMHEDAPVAAIVGFGCDRTRIGQEAHFAGFLDELEALTAEDIEVHFAAIPAQWNGEMRDLAELMRLVFIRREKLREALSPLWREPNG